MVFLTMEGFSRFVFLTMEGFFRGTCGGNPPQINNNTRQAEDPAPQCSKAAAGKHRWRRT